MSIGEGLTQAEGVRLRSYSSEGYDAARADKYIRQVKTSAGTPYQLGVKIMNPSGDWRAQFSDKEVRRRKAINLEIDALGLHQDQLGSIEQIEALIIQKKTRKFMHSIPNDSKKKLLAESIQLLRH